MTATSSTGPIQGGVLLPKVIIVLSAIVGIPMAYVLLFGVSHAVSPFVLLLLFGGGVLAILVLVAMVVMAQDVKQRTGMAYIAVALGIAASALAFVPWFYA